MIKKVFILCITLICTCYSAVAQKEIILQDDWEFLKGDLGGIWEAIRPASPGSPEAVPVWEKVSLPHSYNALDAVDPDKNYYQGPGWYRTQVEIENPYQNGHTILYFEGAGPKTKVFVHDQEVGYHVGGYDEWEVDITDAVHEFLNAEAARRFKGKVPISIRTDNSRDVQMIPSDMVDFTIYGGLYRKVSLEYRPPLSLEYFHVLPEVDGKGKKGSITLSSSFNNPLKVDQAKLDIEIQAPDGKTINSISKEITPWEDLKEIENFSIRKPDLWSPNSPKLYKAVVRIAAGDQVYQKTIPFGFRHFEFVKHGPFKLNGERLLLRGTHIHEDWAGVGAALTSEMRQEEMQLIKDMGANFIRLGHYQQSAETLQLADSLGLLIWEEIPWNRGGLGNKDYKNQARSMLKNMIYQHYNHPSIILWGLGNEVDWPGDFPEYSKDSIRDFLSELNDLSHTLDPSRKTSLRRCDFCRDILDVYSPSIWAGWYSGKYSEYKNSSKQQMERVDHFIHAEWGADAIAGRHAENPYITLGGIETGKGVAEKTGDAALVGGSARASKDGDWSETYQVDLIDWHLKEQETMPWLTGAAYWVFKDFSTPLRPDNPIPYVNSKGVVERDGTPKEAYHVFQSYWADELMAHIYGHSWPVRWGEEGEHKQIRVYSNADRVELFINGKSLGVKKRSSQDFPAAGLRWEVPLSEGDYEVKAVAYQHEKSVEDKMSFSYQTKKWDKPIKLQLQTESVAKDTTTVVVKALDQNDIPVLDAINYVRFSIAGDGELIDNQGTSSGSRKVQLYNGRAKIRIKNNGGSSSVGVQSDGMSTDLLQI